MHTLILRDDVFLGHDPGAGHPENAGRLAATYRSLDQAPVAGTQTRAPRCATHAELERIHTAEHVDRVARTADRARCRLDPDTATCPASYEAALRAAGATLEAVEKVVDGEANGAFALVRPPGHHAEADHTSGFCFFNNAAVAAEHALMEGGLRRVLIVDPDVHHGNGTQHSFWDREEVFYVSSHRYPFFPGTGRIDETGEGKGRGRTLNIPLPPATGDADFLYLYEQVVEPAVNAYRPELVIVSAGFDTWHHDPIGGMRMTEQGFFALHALFRRWADHHCPGRLVYTLEGGYDPAGVVAGTRTALETLSAVTAPDARIDGPVSEVARARAHHLR